MAQRRGPDGTVRVAISGTNGGTSWANVFWCLLAGGSTASQAALDQWLAGFCDNYGSKWQLHQSNGVAHILGTATLFQPNEQALHSTHGMVTVGLPGSSPVSDLAACVVISWITNVYWKGGKPRNYIPGVLEVDMADLRQLSTAGKSAWQQTAFNFHAGINALSAPGITQTTAGFVSFRSGKADRNPPVFFPFSTVKVHGRLGTQRRRLGKWIA